MRIKVSEEIWEFNNEQSELNIFLQRLNTYLQSSQQYLSFMIIDGVDVFEDYEEYILQNIKSIQNVEVIIKTIKQMSDEALVSTQKYLERIVPQMSDLADEFYKGATSETWLKFEQFLEGLQWIVQLLRLIIQGQILYTNREQYMALSATLDQKIGEFEIALKDRDITLIADFITYELTPILEALVIEVNQTIDNEVLRDDFN